MAESNSIEIELPIDQGEQAYQRTAKTLLAQDVYQKIAEHLKTSRNKTPDPKSQADDLDNYRSHEAILIDGGRGTGKSSVLVNLATYLENDKDLLILKPVDPTLLENGDDLLLNVIVAALMRDDTVRKALQNNERDAEAFYEQLHKLGAALEGIQKQKEQYGLDKLRAFMGNQSLAEHVHLLLKTTLSLTSRKLVVLPIDDVDTSLQLAFDNIEVVRKYLTSPFIVPLISGDLSLYDEVIWREFHKRLTHKKAVIEESAALRAKDLAEEYQRKVLPLPRRIKLPALTSYLQNQKIILTNQDSKIFPLAVLQYWLNALLNERVNGEENSRLEFPLQTVREMTQFINACKHLIPSLKDHLNLDLNTYSTLILPTMLKRLLFMPMGIAQAVQKFEEEYNKATFSSEPHTRDIRSGKERAYKALGKNTEDVHEVLKDDFRPYIQQWYKVIADYFQYHRKGGAAYFTAFTNEQWLAENNDVQKTSVLAHDLFQPLEQSNKKYENFELITGVKKTWAEALYLLPQAWIERIPESTVLSFPVPESGQRIHFKPSFSWSLNPYTPENLQGNAELARQLLVHWSFFSPNQRANLLFHGRIFEVVVASLVRDISEVEISEIINRPPFHSMAAMAHTDTLNLSEAFDAAEDEPKDKMSTDEALEGDQKTKEAISDLSKKIKNWRQQNSIQVPHSWLIYNVMNKAFSQIGIVSSNKKTTNQSPVEIIDSGMRMFNSIWSAFGNFEKGETFGLPRIIAYVNMSSSSSNFEQHMHYRQNVLPFLQKINDKESHHNFKTGSYTFALESHPLRTLLQELLNNFTNPTKNETDTNETRRKVVIRRTRTASSNPKSAATVSTRLNRLINITAAKFNLTLNNDTIKTLDTVTLIRFINTINGQCDPALKKEFNSILNGKKVPSSTPRRYLQFMYEHVMSRENAKSSETGPA